MRPINVVSSAKLTEGSLDLQSLVYREKSSGERTQPWGAPVLIVRVLDENFPSLTSCCLSVRKLVIHWQLEVGTESCVSLFWRVSGMMNEWMIHLYSTLLLYTQSTLQSCEGGGGGGGLSSTTTSVQHPLGWFDGCHRTMAPVRSPHTSYRWRGERVIEPIKWMGIIRRPWMIRASGGNLARTPGLHPYSLREVPWDF